MTLEESIYFSRLEQLSKALRGELRWSERIQGTVPPQYSPMPQQKILHHQLGVVELAVIVWREPKQIIMRF